LKGLIDMAVIMTLYKPEQASFHLEVVYTLENWKKITKAIRQSKDPLASQWPLWDLLDAIDDVVRQASRIYCGDRHDKTDS